MCPLCYNRNHLIITTLPENNKQAGEIMTNNHNPTIRSTHRTSGCLFGLAFGDALGAKTEFLNIEQIVSSQYFGARQTDHLVEAMLF